MNPPPKGFDARIWPRGFACTVAGLPRAQLVDALHLAGVRWNPHAETLLSHAMFDDVCPATLRIVDRTVADLGLVTGGTLSQVFTAAQEQGLGLCPPQTAPYLRLAWTAQAESADAILSAGRSPDAALTIAAPVLTDDAEVPKGFYLRVVDGQQWLRGYRCDNLYRFGPTDRFAFQQAT